MYWLELSYRMFVFINNNDDHIFVILYTLMLSSETVEAGGALSSKQNKKIFKICIYWDSIIL